MNEPAMDAGQSAFRGKIRSTDEYLNLDATDVHIVPYLTGGLGRLMKLIQEDNLPKLQDFGHHTDGLGHFSPEDDCVMVLRYKVKKILDAKGQSAVLVLAEDTFCDNSLVVIKVLHTKFYRLGVQESHVLWRLAMTDPLNHSHTLRILTTFTFDSHYCLVFEPLLPDPLTSIFHEFPSHKVMANIRKVGLRLLATLGFLHQQNLIHTDLKPENILLKYENDLDSVHIVDFGNTINYIHSEVSLYYKDFQLQTPLYRAPEVMFGVPFGPEIDIWSLGCIFAELYLGKPLLYGESTEDILKQMYELLGPFPAKLFRRGKFYKNLKQYITNRDQENTSSKIFEHLQYVDYLFADLLSGMLKYDPDERLTASEAAQHPFFAGHFPVAFLLQPNNGCKKQMSVPLSKKAYPYSPNIAASIKKGQPSSIDLLRIGTSDVQPSHDIDETTILKPSPRYKMKGQNLSIFEEQTRLFPSDLETSGATTPKGYSQHSKPVQSDVSIVKNVISKKKDKFSNNVKEKMSSLLKAIRQEQVLVERNLEERHENEILSPRGNRVTSNYRPTESVRPVPKYGAYKENVSYRSSGFNEPQLMKSPKVEKGTKPSTEGTFIIPDINKSSERINRSTEKNKKFDYDAKEIENLNEIDGNFSYESYAQLNRTGPGKSMFIDKSKSPKGSTGSHHTYTHMNSPKGQSKQSKSSEKDTKAPVSPGFTPSRSVYGTKYIDKSGEKMTGSKTYTERDKLYESSLSDLAGDRKLVGSNINEAFEITHRQLKSPESRKRSHTNDLSDDDGINILSPITHGGSVYKRQKYVIDGSREINDIENTEEGEKRSPIYVSQKSHRQKYKPENNRALSRRLHAVEKREYDKMEIDDDEEDIRSQPYGISGLHNSRNYKSKSTFVDSISSYSSSQHSVSDAGSGPVREESNLRRLSNHSGEAKRFGTSSETVTKPKSKRRVSQEMPTPIEKQKQFFHDIGGHTATDSPEIIYKTTSHHGVRPNARDRLSVEPDDLCTRYKQRTITHSGHMKSSTRKDRKVFKYEQKDMLSRGANYQKHDIEASSRAGNMEIEKKRHDKFSFLGTPASDRKLDGRLAERIALRQKKLQKKARKSLNFQGEEEEISDESFDCENDSDNDSVDLSSGHGMSGSLSREYSQLGQIPIKHERASSAAMAMMNQQHFVHKITRSSQLIDKDRSRVKNSTNKGTRYLNQDATFVLEFESPLRSHYNK